MFAQHCLWEGVEVAECHPAQLDVTGSSAGGAGAGQGWYADQRGVWEPRQLLACNSVLPLSRVL